MYILIVRNDGDFEFICGPFETADKALERYQQYIDDDYKVQIVNLNYLQDKKIEMYRIKL